MEIVQYYPFLKSLPAEIKTKIDWDELYIPNAYEVILLDELSAQLNRHIVLYKKDYYSGKPIQLCKGITSSKLNSIQRIILENYQEKFGAFCIIVAYNRPLSLSETPILQNKEESFT